MADIGYHQLVPNRIYGTANPETSSNPVSRAALQEAAFQTNQRIKEAIATTSYVPPGTGYGESSPNWAVQPGGGNPPITGWTAQNGAGGPAFRPYSSEGIGTVPDWTSDPNPAAAGSYDATPSPGFFPPNRLNRGPIGLQ